MVQTDKVEKETDVYDDPIPDNLSIQDAMTVINVNVACNEPDDCRAHVLRMVDIERLQPVFKEISEGIESTKERVNLWLNMLKSEDYTKQAIDKAIDILVPDYKEAAFELAVQTCKAIGLTDSRRERLYDIAEKLAIKNQDAAEMINRSDAGKSLL